VKALSIQNKKRILRAAKEKHQVTYKGKPIRITADFSTLTLKARRESNKVFQAWKENNCQPTSLYPAKPFFIIEEETKICDKNQKNS
jgi:hypothetical protein